MGQYELVCELEERGLLQECINRGIVPITIAGNKLMYEIYLKHYEETGLKMDAYSRTAEEFRVTERTVERVVKKMR